MDVRAHGSHHSAIRFRVEGHVQTYYSDPFSVQGLNLRLGRQRWMCEAYFPATGQGLTTRL